MKLDDVEEDNHSGHSRELIAFGALDDPIQYQNVTVSLGFEDKDVLIERLFNVQNFVHLECYRLAWPLR
jgi:hypothetical protein